MVETVAVAPVCPRSSSSSREKGKRRLLRLCSQIRSSCLEVMGASASGRDWSQGVEVISLGSGVPSVLAETVVKCKCGTGEGLWWDEQDGLVRFLDIPGKKLFAYSHKTGELKSWATPERPGTWAKCLEDPTKFLVAFETGFGLFDPESGEAVRVGSHRIDNKCGGRLNDGRCDRQGRMVCGGYNDRAADGTWEKLQQLYQVAGKETRLLLPELKVACANSTCFSPEGTTMYFTDTPERKIWAFDYNVQTGAPSNRRDFVDFEKQGIPGAPDGATVDAEGGVWSCAIGSGKVIRFQPDETTKCGKVSFEVETPSLWCTCPALCGPEMDVLYVTSLSSNPSADEESGNLFRAKVPFKGLPEPAFRMGPYLFDKYCKVPDSHPKFDGDATCPVTGLKGKMPH